MPSCQEIQPRLSLFIDDLLPADERAGVVAHIDTCAACRGLVADLERLRGTARTLGAVPPPDHLWLEVAGQIRLGDARSATPPLAARGRAVTQWLGLAAALVLITLGVYMVARLREPAGGASGNAPASASVEGIEQDLKLAAEHYDHAITQLEAIVKNTDTPIDPTVAAVLQKNLPLMDHAIAESRAALTGNPGNEAARDSLFDALRRKVSVLQDTVALMNEMRKGNQEGAARVAAGLNKKS